MGRSSEPAKRPLFPIYDILESWQAFAFATPEVKPQHHALYQALVYQIKVRGGLSRFPLAYQYGMQVSSIGSRSTYAATLLDLEEWGFITHEPGANGYKSPVVDVHFKTPTAHLLDIYRASSGRNKEVVGLEVLKVKEREREQAESLSLLQNDFSCIQSQLEEAGKRIAALEQELLEAQEKLAKKNKPAAKKPAAPKLPASDKLSEVGRRMADAWSAWMMSEHSVDKPLDKLSEDSVAAFNAIAIHLCARLAKAEAYSDNAAVASLIGILLRQKEMKSDWLAKSCLTPAWLAKGLAEIITDLERVRPGSVNRPVASSSPAAAEDKRAAALINLALMQVNKWRDYHSLPAWKVASITQQEVDFYQQQLTGRHPYEWPHPNDTAYAAEWRALQKPVHA